MTKEVKVESKTEDRSLTLFLNKCDGSKKTQDAYLYQLNRFKKWANIDTYDGLLQAPDSDIEKMLEDYIMYKKSLVSPNTIPVIWSALKKFYRANHKKLDYESIEDLFPKKVRKSGKEAYSDEDMKIMLRHALKKRSRALLLFMSSTGCRAGAIPTLEMQHIENIGDGCKAVKIYGDVNSGEDEEYWAFLTPEASKALEEYWEERKADMEFFKKENPVFRADYELGIAPAKPMKEGHVLDSFKTLAQHITSRKKVSATRYNIQIVHGVRKWTAKQIKRESKVSYTIGEKLLGHNKYLDGEYCPTTKEEMFEEFKKVMPDLILDDTERKNLQIEEQQKEITKLEANRKMIEELQLQINLQEKRTRDTCEYLLMAGLAINREEDKKPSEEVQKILKKIEEEAWKAIGREDEEARKDIRFEAMKKFDSNLNKTDGSKKLSEHNSNEGG